MGYQPIDCIFKNNNQCGNFRCGVRKGIFRLLGPKQCVLINNPRAKCDYYSPVDTLKPPAPPLPPPIRVGGCCGEPRSKTELPKTYDTSTRLGQLQAMRPVIEQTTITKIPLVEDRCYPNGQWVCNNKGCELSHYDRGASCGKCDINIITVRSRGSISC